MKIRLHIEQLVLDGLPVTNLQGLQVRDAVERELAQLLAADGLSEDLRRGGAVLHVRCGAIQLAKANHATRLGRQIAGAVYGGVGRTK